MPSEYTIGIDGGPKGFAWAVFDNVKEDIVEWGHETLDLNAMKGAQDTLKATQDTLKATRQAVGRLILWQTEYPDAVVAIEKPMVPYEGVAKGQKYTTGPALETAQVVGVIRYLVPHAILVPRPTVKAAIPGCRANSTKSKVNEAMRVLCPALNFTMTGLNAHTRDAAALAYVALGQWKKQRLTELRD